MPKVSVCVPVYKVEKYIERCARSLFAQTLDDIEYIFVNDCTPDKSVEILSSVLEEYPHRKGQVRIIDHEKNQGSAAARNTCLNAATGEYIGWCDSDDWVEPDMLEKLYERALETDADIVCCNISLEYEDRQELLGYPCEEEGHKDLMYIGGFRGALWNKLIKKSLYINHEIAFFQGLNMWDDSSVTLRLRYFSRRTVVVPEAFYHYNKQNAVSIVTQQLRRHIDEQIRCASILEDFFREQGRLDEPQYADLVRYIKFESKRGLIWSAANRDVKAWLATYPETNLRIWQYTALSLPIRLTLMLAAHGFAGLACWLIDWNDRRHNAISPKP